ncbi:MAG: hypothetical protein KDB22_17965 [Planctomycetales bacterium]|nr:hypothetical protein [Planctomycetales bacterium]
MSKISVHLAALILLLASGRTAMGDLVLLYQGATFSDFVGDTTFSSADRVSGSIVFEGLDSFTTFTTVSATRFDLDVTVNGLPGISFRISNALTDSRVTLNTFDFEPGSLIPTRFALTVEGEAFGDTGFNEELSIADIGDLATIDRRSTQESNAFNFTAGTFITAVPEPSSVSLVIAFFLFASSYRKREQHTT